MSLILISFSSSFVFWYSVNLLLCTAFGLFFFVCFAPLQHGHRRRRVLLPLLGDDVGRRKKSFDVHTL